MSHLSDAVALIKALYPQEPADAAAAAAAAPPGAQPTAAGDEATADGQETALVEAAAEEVALDEWGQHTADAAKQYDAAAQEADALEAYLRRAQEEADAEEERALAEADKEFTPAWRSAGLPSKPPALRLDETTLASAALLDPGQLLAGLQAARARRVLSPPQVLEYAVEGKEPHHRAPTANLMVRETIAAAKRRSAPQASAASGWAALGPDELRARLEAAKARQRALALQMSPAQWELEKAVLRALRTRTAFLRNPRYRDDSSMAGRGPAGGRTIGKETAAATHRSSKSGAAAGEGSKEKQVRTGGGWRWLLPEPGEVVFSDYEAGGVYEATLSLRNTGAVTRGLRLLPPASQYFHVSLPRFPLEAANDVAPGMAAEVAVRFTPDSKADYEDALVVLTQQGQVVVPLRGCRAPPRLTLPATIDVGHVLLGNTRRVQVHFENNGGDGRCRVVPAALWPPAAGSSALDYAEQAHQAALLPFAVDPTELDVPAGAAGSLTVSFAPEVVGSASATIVLVWDNARVQRYNLAGRGVEVEVALEEPDGRPMASVAAPAAVEPADEVELAAGGEPGQHVGLPPLWLGEAVPGAAVSRRLRVVNRTPLPLPFHWELSSINDATCSSSADGSSSTSAAAKAAVGWFALEPSHGVLQPRERLQVTVRFSPAAPGAAAARARLVVDRSASARQTGIIGPAHEEQADVAAAAVVAATTAVEAIDGFGRLGDTGNSCFQTVVHPQVVAELLLQGAGVPTALRLSPSVVRVPGILTRGQLVEVPLQLTNPTAGPAAFQFTAAADLGDGSIALSPNGGAVPPHSSVGVSLFLRPTAAGPLRRTLSCSVRHGRPLQLMVSAEVEEARVGFSSDAAVGLEFGLLRIGLGVSTEVELVNTSHWGPAVWALEQLPAGANEAEPSAAELQQLMTQASSSRQRRQRIQLVAIEPASGELPPSGAVRVRVSCTGKMPGPHRIALRLSSGGGTHAAILEARVTVVLPNVFVEPCSIDLGSCYKGVPLRRTLRLCNTALLPCSFQWELWQQAADGRVLPVPAPRVATHGLVASAADAKATDGASSSTPAAANGTIGLSILPVFGDLQPGQTVKVQLRLDPQSEGPVRIFGICRVEGMAAPRGFALRCQVQGLRVGYRLMALPQWEAAGRPGLAAAVPAAAGEEEKRQPSGAASFGRETPLVLDFGEVQLGQPASQVVVLNNATMMATEVSAWVESHPAAQATGPLQWTVHTCGGGLLRQPRLGSGGSRSTGRSQRGSRSPSPTGRASASAGGRVASARAGAAGGSGGRCSSAAARSSARGSSPGGGSRGRCAAATGDGGGATVRLFADAGRLSPFSAAAGSIGNEMMAARRQQSEGAAALRVLAAAGTTSRSTRGSSLVGTLRGQPLALAIAPSAPVLEPLSSLAVEVVAFTAMPGTFCDTLHVQVGDLPSRAIPVLVRIAGSPLVLQRDRVLPAGLPSHSYASGSTARVIDNAAATAENEACGGLSSSTSQPESSGAAAGEKPRPPFGSGRMWGSDRGGLSVGLEFGKAPVGVPQQRAFFARNRSCAWVSLAWQKVGNDGMECESNGPFSVEPATATIAPGEQARFEVAFCGAEPGRRQLRLRGEQRVLVSSEGAAAEGPADARRLTVTLVPAPGEVSRPIRLQVLGASIPGVGAPPSPVPALMVTVQAEAVSCCLELASGEAAVEWSCTSAQAAAAAEGPLQGQPALTRFVALRNPAACPLTFRLAAEGPFELLHAAAASAPRASTGPRGGVLLPSLQPSALANSSGSSSRSAGTEQQPNMQQQTITLQPGDCTEALVRFAPPTSTAATTAAALAAAAGDCSVCGRLCIAFDNGETQAVPLRATVAQPLVECSTAALRFGPVHLQAPKALELLITNPTAVDATWRVVPLSGNGGSDGGRRALCAAPTAASSGPWAHIAPRDPALNGALLLSSLTATAVPSAYHDNNSSSGRGGGEAECPVGPFTVCPSAGILPGRGLGMPHGQRIRVTFAPRASGLAGARLRIAVACGTGCEVELEGLGSLDEGDEHAGLMQLC